MPRWIASSRYPSASAAASGSMSPARCAASTAWRVRAGECGEGALRARRHVLVAPGELGGAARQQTAPGVPGRGPRVLQQVRADRDRGRRRRHRPGRPRRFGPLPRCTRRTRACRACACRRTRRRGWRCRGRWPRRGRSARSPHSPRPRTGRGPRRRRRSRRICVVSPRCERLGGLAAVGDEVRAGDERRAVGDEEADELGQLGRDARAPERVAAGDRVERDGELVGDAPGGSRPRPA